MSENRKPQAPITIPFVPPQDRERLEEIHQAWQARIRGTGQLPPLVVGKPCSYYCGLPGSCDNECINPAGPARGPLLSPAFDVDALPGQAMSAPQPPQSPFRVWLSWWKYDLRQAVKGDFTGLKDRVQWWWYTRLPEETQVMAVAAGTCVVLILALFALYQLSQ